MSGKDPAESKASRLRFIRCGYNFPGIESLRLLPYDQCLCLFETRPGTAACITTTITITDTTTTTTLFQSVDCTTGCPVKGQGRNQNLQKNGGRPKPAYRRRGTRAAKTSPDPRMALLPTASDHSLVTVDLPRSAPAPLRSSARLTLYKSHAYLPSRMCSLEGRALLVCGAPLCLTDPLRATYSAGQRPSKYSHPLDVFLYIQQLLTLGDPAPAHAPVSAPAQALL